MWLTCKVIKKWQAPHFYIKPPFSGLSPLSSKKAPRVVDCGKVATELNSFFSSVVKNLNIPSYEDCDPLSDKIFHPTLKAIVKRRNHPRILTITSKHENKPKFSFNFVLKEHVLEEIQMLDSLKAMQAIFLLSKLKKTGLFEEKYANILMNP